MKDIPKPPITIDEAAHLRRVLNSAGTKWRTVGRFLKDDNGKEIGTMVNDDVAEMAVLCRNKLLALINTIRLLRLNIIELKQQKHGLIRSVQRLTEQVNRRQK